MMASYFSCVSQPMAMSMDSGVAILSTMPPMYTGSLPLGSRT